MQQCFSDPSTAASLLRPSASAQDDRSQKYSLLVNSVAKNGIFPQALKSHALITNRFLKQALLHLRFLVGIFTTSLCRSGLTLNSGKLEFNHVAHRNFDS